MSFGRLQTFAAIIFLQYCTSHHCCTNICRYGLNLSSYAVTRYEAVFFCCGKFPWFSPSSVPPQSHSIQTFIYCIKRKLFFVHNLVIRQKTELSSKFSCYTIRNGTLQGRMKEKERFLKPERNWPFSSLTSFSSLVSITMEPCITPCTPWNCTIAATLCRVLKFAPESIIVVLSWVFRKVWGAGILSSKKKPEIEAGHVLPWVHLFSTQKKFQTASWCACSLLLIQVKFMAF